jgi:hypothetical protein
LFVEHGGRIAATAAHIRDRGPHYPDFDDPEISRQVPAGHRLIKPSALHKSEGLYYPGRGTLPNLLLNAAYVGHWAYKGQIVKWRNHPAIVSDDLFFEAFNYLSDTTLDGEPNLAFHPARPSRQWASAPPASAARPLCEGMIVSYRQGHWVPVRTSWDSKYQDYKYFFSQNSLNQGIGWQKKALYVDEAVTHLWHAKLRKTFEPSIWEKALQSEVPAQRLGGCAVSQRLATLERSEDIIEGVAREIHEAVLELSQVCYETLAAEPNPSSSDRRQEERHGGPIATLGSFRETYESILEKWKDMDLRQQQVALKAFVEKIIATRSGRNVLHLVIHWRDNTSDTILLSHQAVHKGNVRRTFWLKSEIGALESMIEGKATQVDMMSAFPHRTWASIREVARVTLGRALIISPKPILDHETYQDYLGRMKDGTALYRARGGQRWSPDELQLLQTLVEINKTKGDLAEAFPHRTWQAIRRKITHLYGETRRIPGAHPIRRDETIIMYRARVGQGLGEWGESSSRIESKASESDQPI